MILLWTGFIICTGLIIYSGAKLSRYGDIIAEKTGLGRAWIGLVLMASVTSLPELVTGISAVTFAGVPNIAIGACQYQQKPIRAISSLQPLEYYSSALLR